MKKLFGVVLLALSCQAAMGQAYLQLNMGGHAAKQVVSDQRYDLFGTGKGYKIGLSGVIIHHRWQFEAGVSLMSNSAFNKDKLVFGGDIDPLTGIVTGEPVEYKIREKYSHVFVPVRVGYQVLKRTNWSLTPFLGIAGSYNYSHKSRIDFDSARNGEWKETGFIGHELKKFSAWGGAGAELAYKAGKNLHIVGAPEAWYMLNSFSGDAPVKQHTLTLGLNLGVRYSFVRQKKSKGI